MPKIAVITPTYNRGDNGLLRKTMRSVLTQSYVDFVYLVVDDGSTDSTPAVVNEFARHDYRVRYFKMEREPGRKMSASFAQNFGIRTVLSYPDFSDVEYVTFLHSDDLLAQDSIEKRVVVLDHDERIKLVYGYMGTCNENMRLFGVIRGPQVTDPQKIARFLKKRRNVNFPHHTIMSRIGLLRSIGEYDENMGFEEDQDFSIRLLEVLESGELFCIPEIVQFYRAHTDSISGFYSRGNLLPAEYAYLDKKHGKTTSDHIVDIAHRVVTRPQSLLPEFMKRPIRVMRNKIIQVTPSRLDPFVAQIEYE